MKQILLKTWLIVVCLLCGVGTTWADTYVQLTSIANIDESAEYVLGIDGTGFHKSGTSSWGVCTNSGGGTPLKYKLVKATDGRSFKASTEIGSTTYYLAVPTTNTFTMATSSTAANTDMIIGTTQVSGTNYAVANKETTARHLRLNGTNGLRSYAGTTGTMAFFYKVVADGPTVSSISIKTAPTKTTYMEGEKFDPTGLVITKTLSNATTADVAYSGNEGSFTFNPSLTTELSNETSVSITYGKKTTTQAITVNPFVATAGTYNIVPNNVFWGKSTQDGSVSVTANTVFGPVEKFGVTCEMNSGTSTNSYMKSDHSRAYNGYTLKLTAPSGFNLTAIEFTGSTWAAPSADVGTVDSKKWTGEAGEVTFSFSGTSYLSNIKVTYEDDGDDPDPELTLIGIEATGTPAEFWKGDAFNHNGITVTATWDDDTETDVTSSCEFSGYNMSTAGQQTVTVTYQGETCQYNIEVKTIANTQATAYTVAQAKALIDAGKDLATQVYVAGTVSEIVTAWSDQYNNITYAISDDGQTSGTQFQLFRCATNGAEVGDDVVAQGTLTKHSDTYEFAAGNTIVDIQKPAAKTITALEVSGTPTKTTYNVGDAFETAGLTVTATYSDETQEVISTGFEWDIDYGTGNEALVAGATSVDVMVYTDDDVMSEVYTVNGLTVTVPVTLTSIAVSGTPTKTEYYVGDAFETAGLVVTGTYSDSHQETITEGIEWTVDPETLSLETTSVDVMAAVGSVVSEVFTVNDLTVTKAPFETVTYDFSSFTSGQSVELTDLDGFVITLAKGEGTTNPAWSSNQARVYAKGSLTVKANNAIIKSIEYAYSVNANSKGKAPTIDGVEGATDAGTWDVENKTWTGADEEVTFSTSGEAGNIGFTKLIIKYVESTKIETTLAWSATEFEATIGAENVFPTLTTTPVDLAGVTYESSNTGVATIAADGTISLVKAGETTITANYAGDAEHASASPVSYTLTVVKAPFVPTPAVDGYEVVDFKNVVYSSLTGNETATIEEYEGASFAMAFAKPQSSSTPTKYYANGTAVRAYTDNTITITGAENIVGVDIAWAGNYVDDAVTITGLGTTTAVVTFSKNCRFTKITVSYTGSNSTLVATDGENYYATFSSEKNVVFADATAYTVSVADDKLALTEVARNKVPAGNAVLIKSATANVNYYFVDGDEDFEGNMLVACPTTGACPTVEGTNYYYKLAYGDNTKKTKLGFWWGAEDGSNSFNVKAGGAVLVVPQSQGSNLRGFSFEGEGNTTAIENIDGGEVAGEIFNLQGQRMSRIQKGVNIINGKKVIR